MIPSISLWSAVDILSSSERVFGFTENDIGYLFDEHKILKEDREKAEDWYDGYRVAIDPTLKIYNPWAIVNFLHHKKIANYWEETGNIDFINNLFKIDAIKIKVQSLPNDEDINGQNNNLTLVNLEDLKFSKDNFIMLKELLNMGDNYEIKNETVDLLFRYIFAAGYLTVTKEIWSKNVCKIT